jgi:hypothetical protein
MLHRPAVQAGFLFQTGFENCSPSFWVRSQWKPKSETIVTKVVFTWYRQRGPPLSPWQVSLPQANYFTGHFRLSQCSQVLFLLKSQNPSWTLYRCTLNTVLKGKNLQQLHQLHLGFALKEPKSFEVYTVPDSHKARFKFSRLSLLKRQYQEIFKLRFILRGTGYSLHSRPNAVLNVDWHSPRYLIFMVIPYFRTRISPRI